jgi:glucan-binding YG repeat protein
MKKFVILGVLALSIASFAKGHGKESNMMNKKGNKEMMCMEKQKGGKIQLTPEQQKIKTQYSIALQEKRLEIKKEMTKNPLNWKNIEKLNKEEATLQAEHKTQMMKWRVENIAKAPAPIPPKPIN